MPPIITILIISPPPASVPTAPLVRLPRRVLMGMELELWSPQLMEQQQQNPGLLPSQALLVRRQASQPLLVQVKLLSLGQLLLATAEKPSPITTINTLLTTAVLGALLL